MTNSNNSKGGGKGTVIVAVIIVLFLLYALGSCTGGSSGSSSANGQVRCWYCSKVIYNNGRANHCTHEYLNTYTCDYCGKTNVIK